MLALAQIDAPRPIFSRRSSGHRGLVLVVSVNRARRRGIARRMAAAGLPLWRIAQVSGIRRRERLARILAANSIWGDLAPLFRNPR